MKVFLIRTYSTLDHEGMPDVHGVYETKERAEVECFRQGWEWLPEREEFKIGEYDFATIEEWEVK